jgi:endo-1,4-beta-xylanase
MHLNIRRPSTKAIAETIRMFSTLGIDNQITELDVSFCESPKDSCPAISQDALIEQGYRYRDLFQTFRDLKGELSGVTFWGLADDHTWLKKSPIARLELPLPFDEHLQAKPAYWGIVDPTRLPARPVSAQSRAEPAAPPCSKP